MTGTIVRAAGSVAAGALSRLMTPLSVEMRLLALAFTVGAILYVALFSGMAPVHDATHSLRHSILSVPCH